MTRQSAAVYRRRRLAILLLAIIVVAAIVGGIWVAIAQPWKTPAPATSPQGSSSSSPSAAPSIGATPSGTPSPAATETPGLVACEADDVQVTAVTDAEAYAEGALPKLSITLTNVTDRDCTMNVGSSTQSLTVTSGADVWWRSTDCQSEPSDMIVTLTAGSTVSSAEPVVWDRTRSAVDTCEDENRPRAPGGGASYHVSVSIGGFNSATSRQIFLR